jgi:drug/metabolite transporter (DMT)-like permease
MSGTSARASSTYLVLAVAVLCIAFGSILVRLAEAPAASVAFYRLALASLLLLPFAAPAARRAWPRLTPRQGLTLAGSGLALALHFAAWIASLSYTSVAASVLLVNTTPVWSALLGRLLLAERMTRTDQGATALALAGAGLIAWGDWSQGPDPLRGDALALVGAVGLAIYHVAGRGLRDALPLRAYVLGVWSSSALFLLVLALAQAAPLAGFGARTWLAFLALAVVPTLGGHGLVNRALRALPAPTVGLFMTGEPLGATLLAFLVLGERPGGWTLAGGALVSAALAWVVWAGRRR